MRSVGATPFLLGFGTAALLACVSLALILGLGLAPTAAPPLKSFRGVSPGGMATCYRARTALTGWHRSERRPIMLGVPDQTSRSFRVAFTVLVAGLLTVLSSSVAPAQAPQKDDKSSTVRTPDGLTIAVQEWGNPNGPEILFIHGFSQSHLSWVKQTRSDLARDFRMITYDIRGHGGSDKPLEPAFYKESKRWADEVQAVIDGTGLRRPVLVGWSYAGRIIGDYLTHYGDGRIAGIDFVGATTKSGPGLFGPGVGALAAMSSEDLSTNIGATIDFLRFCTAKPLPPDEFSTVLAFNMMVPPKVRAAMGGRPADYEEVLKKVSVPVLVTHGTEDQLVLVAMGRYTVSVVKGARGSFYDKVGHSTFWEDPARFNGELAAFVRASTGR